MREPSAPSVISDLVLIRNSGARRKSLVEGVAGATHRADWVRLAAAVDGLTQAADMHIDGPLVDVDIVTPNPIEQLFARIDPAGVTHQIFEQPIFGRPQVQVATGAADTMALPVELEIAGLERIGDELRAGAAEQRLDARHELRHREGLDHIVVRARREAAHAFFFFAARRD